MNWLKSIFNFNEGIEEALANRDKFLKQAEYEETEDFKAQKQKDDAEKLTNELEAIYLDKSAFLKENPHIISDLNNQFSQKSGEVGFLSADAVLKAQSMEPKFVDNVKKSLKNKYNKGKIDNASSHIGTSIDDAVGFAVGTAKNIISTSIFAYNDASIEAAIENGIGRFWISVPVHSLANRDIYYLKITSEFRAYGILPEDIYQTYIQSLCWNNSNLQKSTDVESYEKKAIAWEAASMVLGETISSLPNATSDVINSLKHIRSLFDDTHPIAMHINGNLSMNYQWPNESHISQTRIFSFDHDDNSGLFLGSTEPHNKSVLFSSENSLITIAPPGKGKTQCHVLPNLRTYEGSVIILDVKGECYEKTAEQRRQFGQVLRFSPSGGESASYNPLSFIRDDEENLWDDSRLLAEMLVVPGNNQDSTWEMQGRDLLTLFIGYSALAYDSANMGHILDLANNLGTQEMFLSLTEGEHKNAFPRSMRRTAASFSQMKDTSGKQYEGVLSGMKQHLGVWEGARLERITLASEWSPALFRNEVASLYLCISLEEIERYVPVLRVIIGQHVRRLIGAGNVHDRDNPPILFMLDEMPRLGDMAPIREALEAGRSYGLKLWMICQYTGQLVNAYGKEAAEGMIGSCGAQIYMNPNAQDAQTLSQRLGTQRNALDSTDKLIATAQELEGPDYRDYMLVFSQGERPLKLRKVFDYDS